MLRLRGEINRVPFLRNLVPLSGVCGCNRSDRGEREKERRKENEEVGKGCFGVSLTKLRLFPVKVFL